MLLNFTYTSIIGILMKVEKRAKEERERERKRGKLAEFETNI